MAAVWRKQPDETGLARITQTKRGLELRENGKTILYVAPAIGESKFDILGWYWYGLGQNTRHSLVNTMAEAKAQAYAYYKTARTNTS